MRRAVRDWFQLHDMATDVILALLGVLGVSLYLTVFDGADVAMKSLAEDRGHIYRTMATVSTSLLGLVMATVTLMVGLLKSERLTLLRRSGQQIALADVFFSTMKCLGIVAAIAFVALLVDNGLTPKLWFEVVVLGLALLAAIRVARAIWVLEKIVKLMLKTKPSDMEP